jgi:hypothetical protein
MAFAGERLRLLSVPSTRDTLEKLAEQQGSEQERSDCFSLSNEVHVESSRFAPVLNL